MDEMHQIKYSVIIPVYQGAGTIGRCLDSLLTASRTDVEILVVNDGSTDQTGRICREYAQKNPCIRCFDKENGGVSSARNLGLTHARGKYVLFVDGDDYVSPDCFSTIDAHLTDECDFLMFGRQSVCGYGAGRHCLPEKTGGIGQAFLDKALRNQMLNAPFAKVFVRSVIMEHNLRFDERLPIGEDKVFVVQYIVHARNMTLVRESLYRMSTENQHSLSRKKRENLCDYILLEHDLLFEAVERSAYRKQLLPAVTYSYYRSAYTVIRELRKFDYPRSGRLRRTREICARYTLRNECVFTEPGTWIISLPIRLGMARTIDFMLDWIE